MKSHKKFDRPSGLKYRLPGRKAIVLMQGGWVPAKIVRNIYAKPNLTRPSLCEVLLATTGDRIIVTSPRVVIE